jgi:hypothetical protein
MTTAPTPCTLALLLRTLAHPCTKTKNRMVRKRFDDLAHPKSVRSGR